MLSSHDEIEAVAEAVARRIVGPLSERLVKIETLLEEHTKRSAAKNTTRRDRFWKVVALTMSGPACLYTIVQTWVFLRSHIPM